ncbi:MAG: hypothetical protein KJ587_19470 [Alphaproteobacteria bacterium]|nr:hypothetical protein [Alphaproteobacteria bacterium]
MPARTAREPARAMPHDRDTPNSDEALCALRSLCRAEALAIGRDDGRGIEIVAASAKPGHCGLTRLAVSADLWRDILRLGWVVPHETLEGWRVANAGRIALKRMLSRGGGPTPGTRPATSAATGAGAGGQSRQPGLAAERATGITSASSPQQNDRESPLAWLRQRRDRQGRSYLSEAQFAAGERLRRDFTYGSMMPCVTSKWSPVIGGASPASAPDRELELRDGQLRARDRFRAALAAVGPEFASLLVDVCCYLTGLEDVEAKSGWPRRTAKVVLLLALSALARFYGSEDRQSRRCRSDADRQGPTCASPSP